MKARRLFLQYLRIMSGEINQRTGGRHLMQRADLKQNNLQLLPINQEKYFFVGTGYTLNRK